jgi:hypothetical protein
MASMPHVQEGRNKPPLRRTAWPSTSQPVPIAVLSNSSKIVANGVERPYGAQARGFAAQPAAVNWLNKEIGLLPNLLDDQAHRAVF